MASLGGRRFTAVFVALLALGIAASYSNSLGIGFYFDDLYGIRNNSTTLYLGAFLAFLRRRWTLGALLYALALLTKAIAVTLPAMLLIHDFVYRDRTRYRSVKSYLGDWRRLVLPVLLPAALVVAYVAYRSALLPSWTAETPPPAWAA